MQKIKTKIQTQTQTQTQAKPATRTKSKLPSKPHPAAAASVAKVIAKPKTRAAARAAPPAQSSVPTPRPGKQATIQGLLASKEGAGIAALMAATGWQAHSVRAAMSGLRKQGMVVIRTVSAEGGSVYRITGPASAQAKA